MRVKIGDKWYTPNEGPIMVELSKEDKENITNMDPACTLYCAFLSENISADEVKEWMKS